MEVGEAFYNYLLEIDTSDFHAQRDMPETYNKCDAIVERMPVEFKFLKFNYILQKLSVYESVDSFYNNYKKYCSTEDKHALTKTKFCAKLREINLDFKKLHGDNKNKISHDELMKIATERKWIHRLDKFVDDKKNDINKFEEEDDEDDNPLEYGISKESDDKNKIIIDDQAKLIKQLQDQIKQLQQQLNNQPMKPTIKTQLKEFVEEIDDTIDSEDETEDEDESEDEEDEDESEEEQIKEIKQEIKRLQLLVSNKEYTIDDIADDLAYLNDMLKQFEKENNDYEDDDNDNFILDIN
jgi:hypothetical protein